MHRLIMLPFDCLKKNKLLLFTDLIAMMVPIFTCEAIDHNTAERIEENVY